MGMREQGFMWSGLVSIYTTRKKRKKLNAYWKIDGRLLTEFINSLYHCALQKCFPHWVSQGFPYFMRTLLYLSEGWLNCGP